MKKLFFLFAVIAISLGMTACGGSDSSSNNGEYADFISKGKSGDIDKMIEAFEWFQEQRAKIKPQVRNLDKDAIKTAVKLDEANEEIGSKYDCFTLSGALDQMEENMNDSQLSRYHKAITKMVYFYEYGEDNSEFNEIYNQIRYGAN